MKKLNNIKLKKLITSLVLDAIQIAVLLGGMVYTQVLALHIMIAYFPSACHKGTFGTFIALFLVGTLCAAMLWMILPFIDKYKVMIFGERFPSFWKKENPVTEKLREGETRMPTPPLPAKYENLFFQRQGSIEMVRCG